MRNWEPGPWYIMRMKLPIKQSLEAEPSGVSDAPTAEYLCLDGKWRTKDKAYNLRDFTTPESLDAMIELLESRHQKLPYRPSDPQLPEYDYSPIPRDKF